MGSEAQHGCVCGGDLRLSIGVWGSEARHGCVCVRLGMRICVWEGLRLSMGVCMGGCLLASTAENVFVQWDLLNTSGSQTPCS